MFSQEVDVLWMGAAAGLNGRMPFGLNTLFAVVQQSCRQDFRAALVFLQGAVVAIENADRRIFGLQYHPEVMHSEQGTDTIRHFLLDIAGLTADWTMAEVLETQLKLIEQQVLYFRNGCRRSCKVVK